MNRQIVARVVEPRVDIQDDNVHIVNVGGQTYYYTREQATGSTNQTEFSCNIDVNNRDIIDRRFLLRMRVEFTFDAPPNLGVSDALRQLPLASVMNNLRLEINSNSVSTSPEEYIHAYMKYMGDPESRELYLSHTAAMPDGYLHYNDWSKLDGIGGQARNPLGGYGNVGQELGRASVRYISAVGNVYTYEITEPLFISPLLFLQKNEMGFQNVNNIKVNITWSNLSRMWSHDAISNPALTTVTARFVDAGQMLITRIAPNMTQKLYPVVSYQYLEPQRYPTTVGLVTAGTSVSGFSSNAIKISVVPSSIMVFVRRTRGSSSFNTTDTFARIDRVRVIWDNRELLSSSQPEQLYQMCRKNGLNENYQQFRQFTGSVIKINLSSDTGLSDVLAPGTADQSTLRVEIDFTNQSDEDINYEYYLILNQQGLISISENSMINTIGNLTKEEVLNSEIRHIPHEQIAVMGGSGLFGDIKHFLNRASRVVEQVSKPLSHVPGLSNIAGPVSDIASGVRRLTGGGIVGGQLDNRKLTRSQLKLLRNM